MSFVSQMDATKAMAGRKSRSAQARLAQARALAPVPAQTALNTYSAAADKYIARVHELIDSGDTEKLARYLQNVRVKTVARRAARQAQQHARSELGRAIGKKVKANATGDKAVQGAFVAEQERLFLKLGADVLADVLAGDTERAKSRTQQRARLITADQVYKVGAESTGYYAINNGAPSYVWITRADERVRPKHAAQHGKIQRWDSPPAVGREGQHFHPSQDISCRCVASPIPPK